MEILQQLLDNYHLKGILVASEENISYQELTNLDRIEITLFKKKGEGGVEYRFSNIEDCRGFLCDFFSNPFASDDWNANVSSLAVYWNCVKKEGVHCA